MRRLTLKRQVPLVRCASINRQDPQHRLRSCGEMIPYTPRKPCPCCGVIQVRSPAPIPGPDALIITDEAVIVDEDLGEIVAVQSLGDTRIASAIAQQLRYVKWQGNASSPNHVGPRLSGIVVTHSAFGYSPPSPLRRRWGCAKCRFDQDYRDAIAPVYEFVRRAERKFRQMAPDAYNHTAVAVHDRIPRAWLIEGSPWTSGIINNTAALPYHRDSGNIPGSWSAMIACRSKVEGGFLHLADYDAYLAVPHGSITIFDGQSVLHGVTPFRITSPAAYRYTLVTYAKSAMKDCAPDPANEATRAALATTTAELKRSRPR